MFARSLKWTGEHIDCIGRERETPSVGCNEELVAGFVIDFGYCNWWVEELYGRACLPCGYPLR